MSFVKIEPPRLGFNFQPKTSPPRAISIARTQDQNPGLPHPNQPPTTQIRAPCTLFAKAEPPLLVFGFLT